MSFAHYILYFQNMCILVVINMCCTFISTSRYAKKTFWSLWTIREDYFITAIVDLWLFTLWTFFKVIHNYRSWILKGLCFIDPLINTFKETGMYVYAYIIREVNFRIALYLFCINIPFGIKFSHICTQNPNSVSWAHFLFSDISDNWELLITDLYKTFLQIKIMVMTLLLFKEC